MEAGAPHAKLAAMAGEYRGEEHTEPSPWAAGGVVPVTIRLRSAVDGLLLVEDYESATLRGHGVFSADAGTGAVLRYWWDSLAPPTEPARGAFDGELLALERSSARGTNRTTWLLEDDALTYTVAFRAAGAEALATLARVTAVRAPGGASPSTAA
jgi:hypothetical protein